MTNALEDRPTLAERYGTATASGDRTPKRAGTAESSIKPRKPKTCDKRKGGCGQKFIPSRAMQKMCGIPCALAHVEWQNARSLTEIVSEDKRQRREQCKKLKTMAEWAEDLQEVVNRYVRLRDHKAGYGCITCKTMKSDIWDAGHFHGRRARPELRFDLANIHLQCRACNYYHATGATYRNAILERIGQAELDRIDGPCPSLNYRRPQYEEQIAKFRAMVKELERG